MKILNNKVTRTMLIIIVYVLMMVDRAVLIIFPFIDSDSIQTIIEYKNVDFEHHFSKVKNSAFRIISAFLIVTLTIIYTYSITAFLWCIFAVSVLGLVGLGYRFYIWRKDDLISKNKAI